MPPIHLCPQCGAELPPNKQGTPCPACLMKLGLQSWTQQQEVGRSGQPGPTTSSGDRFVAPEPQELAPLFPQLEILELLGKGGMGAVYKARQPALDRLVAVKILPTEISHDPSFTERFSREARAMARLNHPHIVNVYDFGQVGGLCYFIMEYVDGANLRQVVQLGQVEPRQALTMISQICEALQFAHDEGIVHRDIKPENILVDRRGRVKIADFGLAKLLSQTPLETTLTQERQVMGTWHYMAPEQMEGSHQVDHRADLYSLGVVFYELLTGELPLGRFALPSKKYHLDVRLDEIVLRALERKPERRYQTASQLKSDLEAVSGHPRPAPPQVAHHPPLENSAIHGKVRPAALLMMIAGILNLVPLLFLVAVPILALVGGMGMFGLGFAEILILMLTVPIGILQIFASQVMRNLQSWGLALTAAVVSLFPCGLGFPVGLIAGIWGIVVLNDPPVRDAFQGRQSKPGLPERAPLPAKPSLQPRFSRKAIVGLLWAPLVLLPAFAILPAYVSHSVADPGAPTGVGLPVVMMVVALIAGFVGVSAPFGTTILGLLAIHDIRHSNGQIAGLPLAVADALLFPLLLLNGLVFGLLFYLVFALGLYPPLTLPLTAVVCLFVNTVLIRAVWRSAKQRPVTGEL